MITTIAGQPASRLGLASYPDQDLRCVKRAFDRGINYFFFYSPGQQDFMEALARLLRKHREKLIVATGSGSRKASTLRSVRNKAAAGLGLDILDVFFAEYVNPADDAEAIFGAGGVLDELTQWKEEGLIRYVGATAHDRPLARRLAGDRRVDVLMHRYNMAHRKAAREVFPAAIKAKTPVIAFTATRWGTLLQPRDGWSGPLPTAADCYRFCLAERAVHIVLSAAKTLRELETNIDVLDTPRMGKREAAQWQRYGDAVYSHGKDKFETQWP